MARKRSTKIDAEPPIARQNGIVDGGEFLLTLRANSRGELVVGPVVQRRSGETSEPGAETSALTQRELDVLQLLARGWDNGRIAADLYISRATVKRHISSILKKLGVDNRVQAAVRAVQEGLLPGHP